MSGENLEIISISSIGQRIHSIRGQKILLDADLAELYGVETKVFNQAIRRHRGRFPEDFMFQLNIEEFEILRSQFVTSSLWGGRRYPPLAFTEQGVAMLSSVLNSPRAIQVNIAIMRTFVLLRGMLVEHKDLAKKLNALERKYDEQFKVVFEAIRELMIPPVPDAKRKKRAVGFAAWEEEKDTPKGKKKVTLNDVAGCLAGKSPVKHSTIEEMDEAIAKAVCERNDRVLKGLKTTPKKRKN